MMSGLNAPETLERPRTRLGEDGLGKSGNLAHAADTHRRVPNGLGNYEGHPDQAWLAQFRPIQSGSTRLYRSTNALRRGHIAIAQLD
jgi:hypothetical protein